MELLAAYSSDESDDQSSAETEQVHSNEQKSPSKDYFNLEGDPETDDPRENRSLSSYDLVMQSQLLSTESYGPSELEKCIPNAICSKHTAAHVNQFNEFHNKRCFKRRCTPSNTFLHLDSECNTEWESNFPEFQRARNPGISKALNQEIPTYYIHPLISSLLAKEPYCHMPRRQFKTFSGHNAPVSSLHWCVTQYSHLLLSSSLDYSVKLWDMNRNNSVLEINDSGAVKSAKWSLLGTEVFYGGFNKKVHVLDVNAEKISLICDVKDYVYSLECHPEFEKVVLVGTKDEVLAFDKSAPKTPIKSFTSNCQHILDMAFINQQELLCSCEIVTHDSPDRTLMVWDFGTGAILSNQIYSERYTCPTVAVGPDKKHFIAQSNGDYLVMFSTRRPYRLLNKRYESHKVSGYSIGCDFSADGNFVVSGDADGAMCIYRSRGNELVRKILIKPNVPTVCVRWHPVLSSTVAMASWDGSVQIWQ